MKKMEKPSVKNEFHPAFEPEDIYVNSHTIHLGDSMARVKKTLSLSPMDSKEIDSLVKTGRFASKSDVVRTALRVLLEENPGYKTDIAVELYKEGEVSLGRAAEIAEKDRETFKKILEEREVKIELESREGMGERVEKVEGKAKKK